MCCREKEFGRTNFSHLQSRLKSRLLACVGVAKQSRSLPACQGSEKRTDLAFTSPGKRYNVWCNVTLPAGAVWTVMPSSNPATKIQGIISFTYFASDFFFFQYTYKQKHYRDISLLKDVFSSCSLYNLECSDFYLYLSDKK